MDVVAMGATEVEAQWVSFEAAAKAAGLRLINAYPLDMATAEWIEPEDIASFVELAADVGARLLYWFSFDEGGQRCGFIATLALHGVAHEFHVGNTRLGSHDASSDADLSAFEPVAEYERRDEPEYLSWSQRLYEELAPDQRDVVEGLLADQRFTSRNTGPATAAMHEHAGHLKPQDYASVSDAAKAVYRERLEGPWRIEAQQRAGALAQEDSLDVLAFRYYGSGCEEVMRVLPEADPRFCELVAKSLHGLLSDSDRFREARADLQQTVRQFMATLPIPVQGQLAFTRSSERTAILLNQHGEGLTDLERRRYADVMGGEDAVGWQAEQERRFAAAGRCLLDRGDTRSSAASKLGFSIHILDRLLRDVPATARLEADDPWITVLGLAV